MSGTSQIVRHLSAGSARGFVHHAARAATYPGMAWRHRSLVWNFFRRELLSRFHGSYLGVAWVLVEPMFMFAVYYVIFGLFMGPRGSGGEPVPEFPFYLFAGYILYHTFTEGSSTALRCIVGNNNLVKKVVFPAELLPLSPVLSALVVYVVGCVLLVVVGLGFGQVHVGPALLLWPVVLAILCLLSLGTGLFLASSFVFMRDLQQLWSILTTAFLFLSPIFWWPPFVADKVGWELFGYYPLLNPVFSLLMAQRQVFGVAEDFLFGDLAANLAIGFGFAAVVFVCGYGVFMSQKHKFADLV